MSDIHHTLTGRNSGYAASNLHSVLPSAGASCGIGKLGVFAGVIRPGVAFCFGALVTRSLAGIVAIAIVVALQIAVFHFLVMFFSRQAHVTVVTLHTNIQNRRHRLTCILQC